MLGIRQKFRPEFVIYYFYSYALIFSKMDGALLFFNEIDTDDKFSMLIFYVLVVRMLSFDDFLVELKRH